MDDCPLCKGKTPNATTIAAMEEGRAIQRERRLQSLREKFEAEQNAFCARVNQRNPFLDTDQLFRGTDVDWFAVSFGTRHGRRWLENHEAFKLIDAARHYIIARDFGIFDRKRALMTWKLRQP